MSVCCWLGPPVPLRLPLRVRRKRVVLFWTVARRPAVVTIAALPSGAAFRGSVAVLVRSGSASVPSPRPCLALQHAAEEGIVVSFALGRPRRAITVPRVPSLLWQRGGAAAAPSIILIISVGTPGGAVIPLVDPVCMLSPTTAGTERAGKILQFVQGAGAPSSAQRLPLQVL